MPLVQEENIWDKWQRSLTGQMLRQLVKADRETLMKPGLEQVQALADISCSVLCCRGNEIVHQLQICPTVHNWRAPPTIPPSYVRVHAVVWKWGRGQTDTETATTTIHFASSATCAKCKYMKTVDMFRRIGTIFGRVCTKRWLLRTVVFRAQAEAVLVVIIDK